MLTLFLKNWTVEKTQNYFSVSKRSVTHACDLRKLKGILAEPTQKNGQDLSEKVRRNITKFYCNGQFSRMCPGKKKEFLLQM